GNKNKQILKFDPEIDRTLHKLRKQSKQTHEISSEEVFEEVFDNMAAEGIQEKTLGEYSVPTTASCDSSMVRTTVDANNFELKPSLISSYKKNSSMAIHMRIRICIYPPFCISVIQ
ncbi:hypothetical protein PIB30_098577, partial [Stylosanthes scabra]|nr:hypothetical protein [Stylosanthes scabra]